MPGHVAGTRRCTGSDRRGSWELCAYLDRVWNDAPVAFMAAVEHQQREEN